MELCHQQVLVLSQRGRLLTEASHGVTSRHTSRHRAAVTPLRHAGLPSPDRHVIDGGREKNISPKMGYLIYRLVIELADREAHCHCR